MRKVFAKRGLIVLAIAAMGGGGCTDIKKNLGLDSRLPDEFLVSPYQKRLEVPPSFDLKPPQKGDPRGVDPFRQNEDLLARGGVASTGEREMIRALGPGISPEVQDQLDQEAYDEASQAKAKKGLLEGMLPGGGKKKVGQVIDPVAESKR